MALSSEALLAALKSASASSSASAGSSSYDADEIVMKLAKKNNQAVLSFEIIGTTRLAKKVRVAHDVKVEVMKPGDVDRLKEPMCPEPDVSITRYSLSMPFSFDLFSFSGSHLATTTTKTAHHCRSIEAHV